MTEKLVKFWGKLDTRKPPYIHPDDTSALSENRHRAEGFRDYKDLVSHLSVQDFDRGALHFDLFPAPYHGNLAKADIIVLLLNPGLDFWGEYYGEFETSDLVPRLRTEMAQSFKGIEYPFTWLDPSFSWHPGFRWWERKLRGVLREIAEKKFSGNYVRAMRDLSQRLASIELVPYHSSRFGGGRLIERLESTKQARQFVDRLLPAVKRGEKTLILMRKAKEWGVKAGRNVIVYTGGHTRGAHLGPATAGGRAILRRCGINLRT